MPPPYKKIRSQHQARLQKLFVKLLYGDPFQVYISDIGGIYQSDYTDMDFSIIAYEGRFAFINLGDEFVLGMLHATDSCDLYAFTEVPLAYCRVPTRRLEINVSNIICILNPC